MLACHAGRQLRARVARKGVSASSSSSPACMLSEEVRLGPGELFLHLFSFWEGSTFRSMFQLSGGCYGSIWPAEGAVYPTVPLSLSSPVYELLGFSPAWGKELH